jgi:ABC-2 type transport system ATP-binding protein
MSAILRVEQLTKTFKPGFWPLFKSHQFTAVNKISFSLNKGEILGFLGTNGAGKTTTIQMLLGTLHPTSGSIFYFDKDFATNRIEILKRVSYASGYDKLPARLTVRENLDVIARIYNVPHAERDTRINAILKSFGLWNLRNKETGSLSAGQSTRTTLAKAFISNPDIVLLDEPTASLDPEAAQEVRNFILQQQHERHVSILFTSHNMAEVAHMCDRVLILKQGTIIADNTPEELARSVSLARVHLIITQGFDALIAYLNQQAIPYQIKTHEVEIEVDEKAIASLLANLASRNVVYSQISIDKPTLEDYFLNIAKQ